jgi:hypothetical protein
MVSAHIGGHDAHEDWGIACDPPVPICALTSGASLIARGRERWLALPFVDVPSDPIRGIAFLDLPAGLVTAPADDIP